MDNAVCSLIYKDMRPIAVVEGAGFIELVKALNPSYKLKSRNCYLSKIKAMYASSQEQLKALLQTATDIAFTTDLWSSNRQESYIGITVHWLTTDLKMQHALIATEEMPESSTGVNIKQHLDDNFDRLDIAEKVVTSVADNGSNVKLGLDLMPYQRLSCFAHTLQLAVKAGLKVAAVKAARGAAKHLVNRFKKSNNAATALRNYQREGGERALRVIMEVNTRWNSTFLMFSRLVELEIPIRAVLSNPDIVSPSDAMHLEMTDFNWRLIKELIPVLKPIKVATDRLSATTYPSLSMVYPSLQLVKNAIEHQACDTPAVLQFKIAVKTKLDAEFYQPQYCESYAMMAACIDPRFKYLNFLTDEEREIAYTSLKALLIVWNQPELATSASQEVREESSDPLDVFTQPPTNPSNEQLRQNVTSNVTAEFASYLSEPSLNSQADPLVWWRHRLSRFPHLKVGVMRLLGTPATSVPVEKVFSSQGNIVNKKRNSLLPQHVNILTVLHENQHLNINA